MSTDLEVPAGFRVVEEASPFGRLIGPVYECREGSDIVLGFRVADKHLNRVRIVHGGMLTAFADMAMGTALRANGLSGVTVRMTHELISPCHAGDWIAGHAATRRITNALVFVDCEVRAERRLALTASGIFRRLRRRRG